MDTFVREALARAAFERSKAEGGAVGRHFLEVREGKPVPGLRLLTGTMAYNDTDWVIG